MNANFPKALDFVLAQECAYAAGHDGDLAYVVAENVPGDAGGVTKFGIDQADHPHLDIRHLTLAEATELYRAGEWTRCRCDALPDGLDIALFDIAVNNGPGQAVTLLQRSLNEAAALDPALAVDGFLGPQTCAAAQAGGPTALRRLLLNRQSLYYDIVTAHPTDAKFLRGWLNRNQALALLVNINFNAIA
jgi:lysozyme family protein